MTPYYCRISPFVVNYTVAELTSDFVVCIQSVRHSSNGLIFGIRKFDCIPHKLVEASLLNNGEQRPLRRLYVFHEIILCNRPT